MKKFLLLFIILIATTNISLAEYVSANLLNVRAEANTNSTIKAQLMKNDIVKILDTQNDWVFIENTKANKKIYGWVAKKYLSNKPAQVSFPKQNIQNYHRGDSFEILTPKFGCKESYTNGSLDKCELKIDIYYSGVEDYRTHSAMCTAYLDYLSISTGGYRTKDTARMFYAGLIEKNLPFGNPVTLTHDFKPYETVIKASVKDVQCELLY